MEGILVCSCDFELARHQEITNELGYCMKQKKSQLIGSTETYNAPRVRGNSR